MPQQKSPHKIFSWTPKLAYAVGLLVTDGNLSKDGRHINLRSSETELLHTFKKCLNIENKIGHTNSQRGYRVQFCNIQFYHWLLDVGVFPAKTHTIGAIKVPNKYFRDFLRGHLDGDGNISAYVDRYNMYRGRTYINQRIFTRFISASHIHVVWLRRQIKKLVNINGAFIKNTPNRIGRVPIWELKFAKKESTKLLQWIYYQEDLPCLKRKRIIAEKIMEKIAKERRRKYTFVKNIKI